MTASVVAAFLASGRLNAGTPVAIASVPVSATAPAAKARTRRRSPTFWSVSPACSPIWAGYDWPSPRNTIRTTPTPIMSSAETMNR